MNGNFDVVTVTLNPAIDQTIAIPGFTAGEVNRVAYYQSDAGGKGVNVASNLADYGLRAAVTGFLGKENDQIFKQLFTHKDITDRFVRIEGSTRVGLKIIDPTIHQTTDINFPGQTAGPEDITQLKQILKELAAKTNMFVLAGSVPASMPVTIYRDLVELLKEAGKIVCLDTSGKPLQEALQASPDFIKPNDDELSELVGRKLNSNLEILEAAQALGQQYKISSMTVSMGKKGAIFLDGTEKLLAVPGKVEVKSSVGAGDAMVAGVVAGKLKGLSLADTARLATAFSMNAVSRLGSGLASKEVLESFAGQVSIEMLAG